MYLDRAKQILNNEYKEKYALAHLDYQKDFMNEKIKHSYQVLGVGNVILKHEKCFAELDKNEHSYYQAVVLLHDVARFTEILEKEKNNYIDHGIVGAQMLQQKKFFIDNADGLAIKHHGHLIEELYADDVYKALLEERKKQIQKLAFLVRDADKMANFYLLVSDFVRMKKLFFVPDRYKNPFCKVPSEKVLADFMAHKSIDRADMNSFADFTLMLLAWIFDLNYGYSFILLKQWQILEKLVGYLACFWNEGDDKLYLAELNKFAKERL